MSLSQILQCVRGNKKQSPPRLVCDQSTIGHYSFLSLSSEGSFLLTSLRPVHHLAVSVSLLSENKVAKSKSVLCLLDHSRSGLYCFGKGNEPTGYPDNPIKREGWVNRETPS